MLRLPAALVMAAAMPGEADRPPSWPPNSTAHIRPRPRTSMMGYLSVIRSIPCTASTASAELHMRFTCSEGADTVRCGGSASRGKVYKILSGQPW